jgi:Protein of unknown function (DUF1566)
MIGRPCRLLVALLAFGLSAPSFAACPTSAKTHAGGPRFVKDAEIEDRASALVWQRCSLGLAWSKADGCSGDRAFLSHDDALKAAKEAGGKWCLPTAKELTSHLDWDCGKPARDTSVFADIEATAEGDSKYWTSTSGGVDDMMVYIDMMDGRGDIHSRGYSLQVRLVRNSK